MPYRKIELIGDTPFERLSLLIAGALAFAMVAMAIIGAVQTYTPVPYSDMWYGYLGFLAKLQRGGWALWWSQHNEHRIILARLFFWIDHKWFGTEAWFLIVVNYALAASACLLFWRIALDAIRPKKVAVGFGFMLTAWLFLWCQEENFAWGFQSQFFLAQLVPLCAFYWLHRSAVSGDRKEFLIALGFGIASIGTMANGILGLPLMLLFSLLTRQKPARSLALALVSAAALFMFFRGYYSPVYHGSLAAALKNDPFAVFQYVLIYLGSPFYHLFGQGNAGMIAASAAGLLFVIGAMHFAFKMLRGPRENTLAWAMMLYVLYMGATALGTAGGRVILGVGQALAPRYTTPAIMGWSALLILAAPTLVPLASRHKKKALLALAMFAMLALSVQVKALKSREEELFQRKIAGLAFEIGAKDSKQIHYVLNPIEYAMPEVEMAVAQKLSIFGTFPLRGVREALGTGFPREGLSKCQASLDAMTMIEREPKFLRIEGWIFDPDKKIVPAAVRLLDEHGKMIGYAITGGNRPDVAKGVHKHAGPAGFQGYLLADQLSPALTLRGENRVGPACQVQVSAPASFYSYAPRPPKADQATVSAANILPGRQWLGSDYARTVADGMRIVGSYIASDADVGSIEIRIKRGDRLFYRSGPTAGRQLLEFPGTRLPAMKLPVAAEWVLLDFSGPFLPENEFVVRFTDNGSAWGEWSAIALKEHD